MSLLHGGQNLIGMGMPFVSPKGVGRGINSSSQEPQENTGATLTVAWLTRTPLDVNIRTAFILVLIPKKFL